MPSANTPMPAPVILDEGPHHVVVDKPANMVVVRGRGAPRPTLLDVLDEHYGKPVFPVHRLDRVTTGACAFAKTSFAQTAISEAFRKHLVDKRYLAVVEGVPEFTKLAIDARLLRLDDPDAKKGPLARQIIDETGQRALTRVRVLARGDGAALVLAQPETGRMHQIRAHLAHVGHPIVGDALYGATTVLEAHHIALHAFLLSLPLPSGGRAFVNAPLPPAMRALLEDRGIKAESALLEVVTAFMQRRDRATERAAQRSEAPKRGSTTSRPAEGAGPQRARGVRDDDKRGRGKGRGAASTPGGRRDEGGGRKGRGPGGPGRGPSGGAPRGKKGPPRSR